MSLAVPELVRRHSQPVPRLLVELPSWTATFFGNLRDLVFPHRLPRLEIRSAPAQFWPDVFVRRQLPWSGFVQSVACHLVAFALLIVLSRIVALQPKVATVPAFERSQVIYYQPSEYLPPLDTRTGKEEEAQKADPEFSKQPVISLPRESDNRSQTVVVPPNVRLQHEVALPNVVAWSDKEKPQLAIPSAPLTPAAQIDRIAPQIENSVVAPPSDVRPSDRRTAPTLQTSVVAPPSDINVSRRAPVLQGPQPAVIAPPSNVQTLSTRTVGDLNIGRSAVIAAAPQLAVAEQHTLGGGRAAAVAGGPQVVAPPPSLGASGSTGSGGRMIALNLHPAVGAPADPPAGNRRGTFAATPTGHPGASGTPGAASGNGSGAGGHGNGDGNGAGHKAGDLPSGLYVGNSGANPAAVAGDPGPTKAQVNPNLMASVSPPRVNSAPATAIQPGNPAKLSEAERAVFGDRRFYSLTLNMPNLNSAGGSWVIRFAEIRQDPRMPAADLSQPTATRKVDPAYPLQLMRENVAGTVILYAVIHADGTVGDVRILRGVDDRLDRFASEAVAQWKFNPATKNGTPVDVEATFQIPFRPARRASF